MGPAPAPTPAVWKRVLQGLRLHKWKAILGGLTLFLGLALILVDVWIAGPMRDWAERVMNANLKGYTVRLAKVRPHLWRLAFDLDDLVLVQNTHPNPPVANFGVLKFSLIAKELLRFKVAGDLTLVHPALHINLAQIEEAAFSEVSLKDRGWQNAVESIYPFKLDRVKVQDGSLVYLSSATASKPLQFTQVSMVAENVRNVAAAKGTFPSPVNMEGVLFETGKVGFRGAADFLRQPYAAAQGEIRMERVPLDRLNPLAKDYQLRTTGGLLSMKGSLEYTPESQMAHLREVLFENLRVDYVTSKATRTMEKEHGKQAVRLAKRVRNAPHLRLQLDSLKLTNSEIGFVNEATRPPYRLFLSSVNLDLANLSNQGDQGRSRFLARGAFMGSGTTTLSGGARPTASPADFDVQLRLDAARLTSLNAFLQAHADVDVAKGVFSVYTEITVKDQKLNGYIKPLLRDLKIYEKAKDQGKPFRKRVKMHVLQFLANLFRNHSSHEVATVVRISGSTRDPIISEWEAIRRLIGNGFSDAILPGFLNKPKAPDRPSPAPQKKAPQP
jgi:hypothetical protein